MYITIIDNLNLNLNFFQIYIVIKNVCILNQ